MGSRRLITLAVVAVLLFGLAGAAFAQSQFNISSSPLQERQTGVTETAGDILLTDSDTPPGGTIPAGTNLTVTFIPASAVITNDPIVNGTNLTIQRPGDPAPTPIPGAGLAVGALSNSLIINFLIAVPVPTGTFITIRGVRINDQASGITFPGQIQAQLNVTPPVAIRFTTVNTVNVSTPLPTLAVSFPQPNATMLQCLGQTITRRVVLSELFSAVFTSIAQETNLSATPPPTNPTRVEVQLSNVPGGLTVVPPVAAELRGGAGSAPTLTLNTALSQMNLLTSAMTRSILLTYEITGEPDLGAIERTLLVGEVPSVVGGPAGFDWTFTTTGSVSTQALGCVGFQVRLAPLSTTPARARFAAGCPSAGIPSCVIPRFVDPFIPNPAQQIACVVGCKCNLKFPFVTNVLGYDTGMAIANTTADPYGTAAQSGTITLHFFGTNAPNPPRVDTASIGPGQTYTNLLRNVAPGFQGYIIAIANFQFCEGFVFIGDAAFANIAQGYVGLVIPDPVQVAGLLGSTAPAVRIPGFVAGGAGGNAIIIDNLGERLMQ